MSNERAQAIRYMIDSEGWRLVEPFIQRRIEAAKNQLMTCPLDDIPKHRATAIALQAVLLHIDTILKEGSDEDA